MDAIEAWQTGLDELLGRMDGLFANRFGRERLARFIAGLLSRAEWKNGWQLAEEAGEATPPAMQQFLFRGGWEADALIRETRRHVVEGLGDPERVVVID